MADKWRKHLPKGSQVSVRFQRRIQIKILQNIENWEWIAISKAPIPKLRSDDRQANSEFTSSHLNRTTQKRVYKLIEAFCLVTVKSIRFPNRRYVHDFETIQLFILLRVHAYICVAGLFKKGQKQGPSKSPRRFHSRGTVWPGQQWQPSAWTPRERCRGPWFPWPAT